MDCETARRLMDEPEAAPGLDEHLQHCAACRSEAAFAREMAAAVAALPRVPAPEPLLGRVMGELRRSPAVRPARRRVSVVLQPWELGWIGAACLALTVLFFAVLPWRTWGADRLRSGREISLWVSASLGSSVEWMGREIMGALRRTSTDLGVWSGIQAGWLAGAAGFALGLFFLLSWHGRAGEGEWEDAHA